MFIAVVGGGVGLYAHPATILQTKLLVEERHKRPILRENRWDFHGRRFVKVCRRVINVPQRHALCVVVF